MARRLEQAGFASLWVSDHVVMPTTVVSRYPYSGDGAMTWVTDDPWYDALIVLAQAAAVTESVELGTAVLVLPQRNPVLLAKQVASLDRLAGGRVVLGVGAGWLAEEFDALDDAVRLAREPHGRVDRPPARLLDGNAAGVRGRRTTGCPTESCASRRRRDRCRCSVGGTTAAALRRARERGDGWVGIQSADTLDVAAVVDAVRQLDDDGRRVLRVVGSAGRVTEMAAVMPGPRRPRA